MRYALTTFPVVRLVGSIVTGPGRHRISGETGGVMNVSQSIVRCEERVSVDIHEDVLDDFRVLQQSVLGEVPLGAPA